MSDRNTVLVRVSGHDHPGITAGLLGVLATADVEVYDMEQVVTRERLTLDLLIAVPRGRDVLKELLFFGWEQGVQVDFEVVEDLSATPVHHARFVVSVMAQQLTPAALAGVARAIADGGGNIDRIGRLSRYPVVSYELLVVDGDLDAMRAALVATSREHAIDLAIQRESLERRAKRLVVMDVDSTLIQDEVIELLANEAGCLDEIHAITERAMAGELDFEASLRERVRLLAGLEEAAIDRVREKMQLTPGARTFVRTLKRLGYTVAIVSGGFTAFTDTLMAELGIDHAYANELEIRGGTLTGELVGPIVDRARKAAVLTEVAAAERVPVEQTVAIGDGANDLDMLGVAGLGIAFNAKPVVRDAADTAVSVPYLDAILFLLGIRRDEVEEADEADPSVDTSGRIPVPGTPPV